MSKDNDKKKELHQRSLDNDSKNMDFKLPSSPKISDFLPPPTPKMGISSPTVTGIIAGGALIATGIGVITSSTPILAGGAIGASIAAGINIIRRRIEESESENKIESNT